MSTTPTQATHPWKATLRTVAAYAAVAVPALIIAIPIISEELGPYLPESWLLVLATVTAVLGALVGAVTRIMAIPGVIRLLSMVGLGTGVEPKGRRVDLNEDGDNNPDTNP